mgnify:CR=1 FL=1
MILLSAVFLLHLSTFTVIGCFSMKVSQKVKDEGRKNFLYIEKEESQVVKSSALTTILPPGRSVAFKPPVLPQKDLSHMLQNAFAF